MAENTNIYYGSGVGVAGNIDIGAIGLPADSRVMVKTIAGLAELQAAKRVYDGMLVYVEDTHTYHKCRVDWDANKDITSCTWTEVVIKSEEELRAIITATTTAAMEFKGATATLPATAIKGDMYKVSGTFTVGAEADAEGAGFTTEIGDSIVYNGEKWYLIPSGDDIENTWRIIKVEGESLGTESDGKDLNLAAGAMLDVTLAENGTVTYKHEAVVAPEDKGAKWVDVSDAGYYTDGKYKIVCTEEYMQSERYNELGLGGSDAYFSVNIWQDGTHQNWIAARVGDFVDGVCEFEHTRETVYSYDENGNPSTYDEVELYFNPAEGIKIYKQETARTYITGVETDGFGHITGYTTATETVVDTNTTYEFEGQTDEATSVYLHVKASDADQDEVVYLDAYSRNETYSKTDADNTFKTKQDAVADVTADGTSLEFISSVTQNENGEITATKKTVDLSNYLDKDAIASAYKAKQTAVADVAAAGESVEFIASVTQDEQGVITATKKSVDFSNYYTKEDITNDIIGESATDENGTPTEVGEGTGIYKNIYTKAEIDFIVEADIGTDIQSVRSDLGGAIDENKAAFEEYAEARQLTDTEITEAIEEVKDYAEGLEDHNTTYTVAPTTNALELTLTPSEGEAQTIQLVAPTVDVGVTKVTAGTDIVVTPEAGTGAVTVAHKAYQTGEMTDTAETDPHAVNIITGVKVTNGHIESMQARTLKQVLEAMEFIFDGGEVTLDSKGLEG